MISFKSSDGTFTSLETSKSGEVLSATHPERLISMIWCFELVRQQNLGASPNKNGGSNVVPFTKTAKNRRS